jgi:hypothetical protein
MKLLGPMRAELRSHVDDACVLLRSLIGYHYLSHKEERVLAEICAEIEGPGTDWEIYRHQLDQIARADHVDIAAAETLWMARQYLYQARICWEELADEEKAQCAAYRMGAFV